MQYTLDYDMSACESGTGVEWDGTKHTLEENQEHICCKAKIRSIWVPKRLEWQRGNVLSLYLQRSPESDMREFDDGPNDERSDTGQGDQRVIQNAGGRRLGQK